MNKGFAIALFLLSIPTLASNTRRTFLTPFYTCSLLLSLGFATPAIAQDQTEPPANADSTANLSEAFLRLTLKYLDISPMLHEDEDKKVIENFQAALPRLNDQEKSALLDLLNEKVSNGNLREQVNSIQMLRERYRDKRSVPALKEALIEGRGFVFWRAAEALGEISAREAAIALLDVVQKNPEPENGGADLIAVSLDALKKQAHFLTFEEAKNVLTTIFSGSDQSHFVQGIQILRAMENLDADNWSVKLLTDSQLSSELAIESIRLMNRELLVRQALPLAREKLKTENSEKFATLVAVLELIENPNSTTAIEKAVQKASARARFEVISLLGDLGTTETLNALKEIINGPQEEGNDLGRVDSQTTACRALSKCTNKAALKILADWAEVHFYDGRVVNEIGLREALRTAFTPSDTTFSDEDRRQLIRIYRAKLKYPSIYIRNLVANELIGLSELPHRMINDLLFDPEIQKLLEEIR